MIVPFSPHWQLHFPNRNCFSKSTFFFFVTVTGFSLCRDRRAGVGPASGPMAGGASSEWVRSATAPTKRQRPGTESDRLLQPSSQDLVLGDTGSLIRSGSARDSRREACLRPRSTLSSSGCCRSAGGRRAKVPGLQCQCAQASLEGC